MKRSDLTLPPKDELTIWLPSPDKLVLMDTSSLSESDRQALKIFERITAQTPVEEAVSILDQAIAILGPIELPQIPTGNLRANANSNIAEYDQFFRVARLIASNPSYWLWSLFVTYQRVLLINALDQEQSLTSLELGALHIAFKEMAQF